MEIKLSSLGKKIFFIEVYDRIKFQIIKQIISNCAPRIVRVPC
jgi:hypothetical protein